MSTDGGREREQLLDQIMGYVLDATQAGATPGLEDIRQRFPCVSDDVRLAAELESMLSMHGWFRTPLENTPLARRRDRATEGVCRGSQFHSRSGVAIC